MIEIEVEMDSDVLAAEAASNAVCMNCFVIFYFYSLFILLIFEPYDSCLQESISEQIQQTMELENLEEACAFNSLLYFFLREIMGNVSLTWTNKTNYKFKIYIIEKNDIPASF